MQQRDLQILATEICMVKNDLSPYSMKRYLPFCVGALQPQKQFNCKKKI